MTGALEERLEAALGERVASSRPVTGGDLNDALRVELVSGASVFVKTRRGAPRAEFEAEATGLRWLAEAGSLRIPEVRAVGETEHGGFLALEWIEPGSGGDLGARLGRGLAELHALGADANGALPPGAPDSVWRIGPIELAVEPRDSWASFHAEFQLLPLARRAHERGALSDSGRRAVERVCERLADLAGPPEPPSRLHGDLWSGNVLAAAPGEPCLIDPAAYGGHREIDLAMLNLFASPGRDFLSAYEEVRPLSAGAADRVRLWQLLPLLIHAVLFGGSYGASAESHARHYAGQT